MRIREQHFTTEEWEQRVGAEFRSMRLADGRDQAGLARDAAVSLGALRHLERGEGSTLRTVIRVARALGREDWLDALAPAVTVSPLDLMRERRTPRQRVYRERGGSA